MDYTIYLEQIIENIDTIIKLGEIGIGLLFAIFLTRNRRFLK